VKTISIICQKGGVGKTTTVVNVASVFASLGYKTLVLDLDPQGNVSTYLNYDKNTDKFTDAVDLLEKKEVIKPGLITENLDILSSNIKISKFNEEKIVGGSKLQQAFQNIIFKEYEIIIIDTPPTMSSLVQEALSVSDYYLIPAKPEFLAVEGVAQAMEFAKKTISSINNANPLFLGVLLNQIDKRRSSYLEFVSELEYLLADKLLTSKISQTAEIADGPFYAKTVIDFKEDSKSKKEYFDLAKELLKKVGLNEEITEHSDNRY
tara:strand:- start:2868 stop:3659 length:792 start_codon:yes stop_codon:yes gene_type:complete